MASILCRSYRSFSGNCNYECHVWSKVAMSYEIVYGMHSTKHSALGLVIYWNKSWRIPHQMLLMEFCRQGNGQPSFDEYLCFTDLWICFLFLYLVKDSKKRLTVTVVRLVHDRCYHWCTIITKIEANHYHRLLLELIQFFNKLVNYLKSIYCFTSH